MSDSQERAIKRPSISLPAALDDEVESRLGYGDSKAAWIREAIREKLERDCGRAPESDIDNAGDSADK